MKRVQQEHPDGCGRAVLAMLTGVSYAEVDRQIVVRDGDRSLELWQQERFLMERGWFERVMLKATEAPGGVWPPAPFAPLHLAMVCAGGGSQAHSVVMLADGVVLDPNAAHERRLTDWPIVNVVVGLVPPELVPS